MKSTHVSVTKKLKGSVFILHVLYLVRQIIVGSMTEHRLYSYIDEANQLPDI